jgi:N-acyl-D-amino-acid deacylase
VSKILIVGGEVIDGSGAAAKRVDVAVDGDRIVAVGSALSAGAADHVIDATGRVVAPGFIDIHSHYDAQVFWDPSLSSSCHHGVTTVINGNCGFSLAPVAREHRQMVLEMLRDLEDMAIETLDAGVPDEVPTFGAYLHAVAVRRPLLNFASFIGHSTVRFAAMGPAALEREATPDEISQMQSLVAEGLAAGGVGFATKTQPGSRPSPSQYASTGETEALLRILGDSGTGIAMFNPGGNFDLERVYGFQREIGRPFTWIALLAMANGSHKDRLALHLEALESGAEVYPQVSCRPLVGACSLATPSVFRAPCVTELGSASVGERLGLFADASWRRRFRDEVTIPGGVPVPWHQVTITESPTSPDLVGRDLAALASGRGVDPVALLLDLGVADSLQTRIELRFGNDDPAEVARLLAAPGCVLGLSDAGAHPAQLCDAVLPTDLLGQWVRERKAISLEMAVRKLCAEPASLLGLVGRGHLEPGYFADLVVFDPDTVSPGPIRRVFDMPADGERLLADEPTGIEHVLVNGTVIRGESVSVPLDRRQRPGRVLTSLPAA